MATSTTSDFNLQRGRLVDLALTDVGAIGPGGTPSDGMRRHANDLLNSLVKSMDADGALLWGITRLTLTLTAGTSGYSLPTDVLDVDEPARYIRANTTVGAVVLPMSRDEYMSLSDRTVTGQSTRYYQEKSLAGITLYLYSTPDATGDTLEYAAVIRRKDLSTDSNTPDFPDRWLRCLRYGLASDLCPAYSVASEKATALRSMFEAEQAKLLADDNERGGVTFVPFGYSGTY